MASGERITTAENIYDTAVKHIFRACQLNEIKLLNGISFDGMKDIKTNVRWKNNIFPGKMCAPGQDIKILHR